MNFPSPQERKEEKMAGDGAVDPKAFTQRHIPKALQVILSPNGFTGFLQV